MAENVALARYIRREGGREGGRERGVRGSPMVVKKKKGGREEGREGRTVPSP